MLSNLWLRILMQWKSPDIRWYLQASKSKTASVLPFYDGKMYESQDKRGPSNRNNLLWEKALCEPYHHQVYKPIITGWLSPMWLYLDRNPTPPLEGNSTEQMSAQENDAKTDFINFIYYNFKRWETNWVCILTVIFSIPSRGSLWSHILLANICLHNFLIDYSPICSFDQVWGRSIFWFVHTHDYLQSYFKYSFEAFISEHLASTHIHLPLYCCCLTKYNNTDC